MSTLCPIHILLCTDANYAPYCGVTALSALENSGGQPVVVHIFTDSLPPEEISRFKSLERNYGCHIDIVAVPESEKANLPHNIKQWPPATFMRLLAARLLPDNLHRVIYLDCDMVVDCPLRPLWETDIDDRICAVVADGPDDTPNKSYKTTLDIKSIYFNSGMMVMNLQAMRSNHVLDHILDTAHVSGNQYRCPDQDLLNLFVQGNAIYLPIAYNLQSSHLLRDRDPLLPDDERLISDVLKRRKRAIIHYTSEYKPWTQNINHWHPLATVWHHYRRKSPWSRQARSRLSIRTRLAIVRLSLSYRHFRNGQFAKIWK